MTEKLGIALEQNIGKFQGMFDKTIQALQQNEMNTAKKLIGFSIGFLLSIEKILIDEKPPEYNTSKTVEIVTDESSNCEEHF